MNLGDLKRRAYSQSKNLSIVSAVIQWTLLGVAVYSTFAGGPVAPYLGLVAFIAPFLNFALKDRSRFHYGFGERARRAQLLEDGLGRRPSDLELLDLADNAAALPTLEPLPLESEFTSELPKGSRRLAHITQEAAYYSKSQATFAARMYFVFTVLGALGTVIFLWLLVQYPVAQIGGASVTGQNWAKAAATLLIFFVTGSFAEKWRAFESLAKAAAATVERCDGLRRSPSEPSELDVVLAVASYDSALGRAPALPTFIYRLKRKRLHEAWKTVSNVPLAASSAAPS